ncbi:MAG: molecular chaperone HtpG [Pseudomonadales bacterium]|nr:molecular chaperone HtpG [Pseudomonadales bacterium]
MTEETKGNEEVKDSESGSEQFTFQTEAKQLLHLMIHSLYSNREIFLRELISNASDAIDKLRFHALETPSLIDDEDELGIEITFDAEAKTLTIADNGIGMSKSEVISHLGTIAKSGTAEFLSKLSGDQAKDSVLIGQFGVGFYSTFIVADKVVVNTRGASQSAEEAVRWTSKGEDSYDIEEIVRDQRGTEIVLHLKEDALEFADDFRLRSIVRKYSDHIAVPVKMLEPEQAPLPDDKEDGDAEEAEIVREFEAVNEAKALWTRARSDIEDDEYKGYYKHISNDFEDPLIWSHNKVEGKLEYTSLLYLPKHAPFDMWNRDTPRGLKLYVQRVFIMDDAEQFLPLYLRFVKGIIDSNDLPLNISREILQEDDRVSNIKNALTKRVLNMLSKMAGNDSDDYQVFWDEFGQVLKEGPSEDFSNREAVSKLLRFASTHNKEEKQTVSLEDYVERMSAEQEKIYFITGENYLTASNSPHLEIFAKRNIEVLVLYDRVDEWLMSSLPEFGGKVIQDVMRGELDFTADDEKDESESTDDSALSGGLTKRVKEILGDSVDEVRISTRLTTSPSCLVLGEHDMGAQMRKIMEAAGQGIPDTKPNFEINTAHPLIERLDSEQDEDRFSELTRILFDQASLSDGGQLSDPAAYVSRMNMLLLDLLGDNTSDTPAKPKPKKKAKPASKTQKKADTKQGSAPKDANSNDLDATDKES